VDAPIARRSEERAVDFGEQNRPRRGCGAVELGEPLAGFIGGRAESEHDAPLGNRRAGSDLVLDTGCLELAPVSVETRGPTLTLPPRRLSEASTTSPSSSSTWADIDALRFNQRLHYEIRVNRKIAV
jgi:hypothetical protein